MSRSLRGLIVLTGAATMLGSVVALAASTSATPTSPASQHHKTARACAAPAKKFAACMAIKRLDVSQPAALNNAAVQPLVTPAGYGPTDLRSAYALTAAGSAAQTVAIVDAYDDPNAESDLSAYRAQFGLPACTTANGCFQKVNQNGATSPLPAANSGWAGEISLDLDMVSAICPGCKILLVEASSASMTNLGTAVNRAVTMGAKFVSNSYGGGESPAVTSYDSTYFNHPGVVITASSGDSDYDAGSYPATSKYVTAVGGTSLVRNASARGWGETVWNTASYTEGAGSGCSAYIAKPTFQTGVSTNCTRRAESDVSAVADPATGVAVYQTYGGSGWAVYGGTSAAAPIIASVYALAGNPGASDYPNAFPYSHTANLNDVTSGSNGTCGAPICTAGAGWDGPTGLGTPSGTAAFTSGGGTPAVTVTNPGNKTGTVGTAFSLAMSASGGTGTYAWSATGLPAGLGINASTGLISGTPTTAATYNVQVTATSGGNAGSASFTITVSPSGGTTVTVTYPGNKTATVGTAFSLAMSASGGTGTYAWSATGLPPGLSINASTGVISGTPTTAGTYSSVQAIASSGGNSGSTMFTITVSPVASGCASPGQRLANPGFESGSASWTATAGVIGQNGTAQPAHGGTWDAWLDGYGSTHTDSLSQSVTIPSGCSTYTLSFWLHINTSESTTSTQYDKFTVKLGSTTLATYSNLNKASGYTLRSFNVSSFAGQTVTLTFTGTEDSSLATSFVVDDTAVTVS